MTWSLETTGLLTYARGSTFYYPLPKSPNYARHLRSLQKQLLSMEMCLKYILLIMLLQLSHSPPLSPSALHARSDPHSPLLRSCPWVVLEMLISSRWQMQVLQNSTFHSRGQILSLATNTVSVLDVTGPLFSFVRTRLPETHVSISFPVSHFLRKKWCFMKNSQFPHNSSIEGLFLKTALMFSLQQHASCVLSLKPTQNIQDSRAADSRVLKLVIFMALSGTFLSETGIWSYFTLFSCMFTVNVWL